MKTIKIGTLDKPISRIGLGTWAIGGGPAWGGDKLREECIKTIQKCPELGVNLIDTAPGYNFGQSERIVGQALGGMDREKVVVMTKFGIVWTRTGALFNKVGDVQLYKNLSRESILEEIQLSMERLGVDYIDIYMSHWQAVEPFATPIAETVELLNELKSQGRIKAIGAANVSADEVREYLKYGSLDVVQAKYSILDRAVEDELLPLCREAGVVLQAYSPLEMGLLSGALPRDYQPVGAQSNKKWFQPKHMPRVMDFLDELKPLCDKYHCAVADLAMAWILAQGENVILLSGAATEAEIRKNTRAGQLELSPEDVNMMREMAESLDE